MYSYPHRGGRIRSYWVGFEEGYNKVIKCVTYDSVMTLGLRKKLDKNKSKLYIYESSLIYLF